MGLGANRLSLAGLDSIANGAIAAGLLGLRSDALIASGAGADYLCYITPAEHLNLPNVDQVREGVIAFKIAGHIGDTMKFGLSEQDQKMAELRKCQDWEGQFAIALDGYRAREIHPDAEKQCTMCGRFCALQLLDKFLSE